VEAGRKEASQTEGMEEVVRGEGGLRGFVDLEGGKGVAGSRKVEKWACGRRKRAGSSIRRMAFAGARDERPVVEGLLTGLTTDVDGQSLPSSPPNVW